MVGVVRGFLTGFVAALAFAAIGVSTAAAQTYSFDYSGTGGVGGVDSITVAATLTGVNCSSTCTLTSSGDFTGNITVNSTGSSLPSGTYSIIFNPSDTAFGADQEFNSSTGIDNNGITFEANAGSNGLTTFNISGDATPGDGSGGSESNVDIVWDPNSDFDTSGTLTYAQAAPAPVVGGGAWSWLAFATVGLVGLAMHRKTVLASARAWWAKSAAF